MKLSYIEHTAGTERTGNPTKGLFVR